MTESQRKPIAFDIETSGFNDDAVITVAGFSHAMGESLILNTAGREDFDWGMLLSTLAEQSDGLLELDIVTTEQELLELVASFVKRELDDESHYLTPLDGQTWNGGLGLPFCRTRFLRHDMPWPFSDFVYADMKQIVAPFDTNGHSDLVGVYEALVADGTVPPFEESEDAVTAFANAEWMGLLKHTLANIQRTRELARMAGSFIPQSDFLLKSSTNPLENN